MGEDETKQQLLRNWTVLSFLFSSEIEIEIEIGSDSILDEKNSESDEKKIWFRSFDGRHLQLTDADADTDDADVQTNEQTNDKSDNFSQRSKF